MSVAYKPVGWNRNKLIYDAFAVAAIAGYILAYLQIGPLLAENAAAVNRPILRMRAFGTCAFLLLTVVLAIGPLARLDTRFLPLLYNRRHLGVLTAAVAFTHAVFVLDWYYAFSPTPRLVALFTANDAYGSAIGFPFEMLGLFTLVVLVLMAVTSHDFWLSFLTPPVWKSLHMAVYAAYGAAVLHVALGPLAGGGERAFAVVVAASVAALATLHLLAGRRERAADKAFDERPTVDGWIDVGDVGDIAEGRAVIGAAPGGERIAVFRSKNGLSALSNVCSHQNGPIGEGKVVRGLVTCPWHGYQYRLEDGCSPPPFKERLHKYRVRLEGNRILVDPTPLPLGSRLDPVDLPTLEAGG
ncbi:MAG TPA: Rieske 2Fe-2S domain-containing protein [Methylomirabilota bacterium]|nr:Rieske 2Fe-2S domain-containing protein [Methylomirabilota bacterium]